MTNKQFVIRVYAIIINDRGELLVSDEFVLDMYMTKFPGGGLEWGEGTLDCLKREALEEFGQEIEIINHFYTTDYFQQALFYTESQLISIYYIAQFKDSIRFKISDKPFDFESIVNGSQSFRWVKISEIEGNDFTFPIDKIVAGKVKEFYTLNTGFIN